MGKTYYRKNNQGCLVASLAVIGILLLVVAWLWLLSFLVMTLWNIIAVNFGATSIDLQVAFAVVLLLNIISMLLGRGRKT